MSSRKLSDDRHDTWEIGATYESYVGRWSRLVAREFIAWLDVPAGSRWLDVGCGTGALSHAILRQADPATVKGIDLSSAFIDAARAGVTDSRATFEVGDAQQLPVEHNTYDAVVSGLMLNFAPDPGQVVREMARVVKPGGVVAAYVWDYAGQMQMMRIFWDVSVALNPDAAALDEARRFPVCRPESLAEVFEGAGLDRVAVRDIDVPTRFQDFEDYWTPFLGGQGPAPGYVAALSMSERARLQAAVRARLPFNADGSIDLIARAWAVRGVRV